MKCIVPVLITGVWLHEPLPEVALVHVLLGQGLLPSLADILVLLKICNI